MVNTNIVDYSFWSQKIRYAVNERGRKASFNTNSSDSFFFFIFLKKFILTGIFLKNENDNKVFFPDLMGY